MVQQVPLNQGLFALVDDADFDRVTQVRWSARTARRDGYYVQRRALVAEAGPRTVYLHRYLTAPPAHMWVDHINGDGLDNRRCNLRVCSPGQNSVNRENRNASGYRGLERTISGSWQAKVQLDGIVHRTRAFANPEDAARAYDELAVRVQGEFARLNFPTERVA